MIDFAAWAEALSDVETGDKPYTWGDAGLAAGRWQQHPAFFVQWFPRQQLTVGMSWDEAFGLALPALAAATKIWRKMFESEEQLSRDGIKFVRDNLARRV